VTEKSARWVSPAQVLPQLSSDPFVSQHIRRRSQQHRDAYNETDLVVTPIDDHCGGTTITRWCRRTGPGRPNSGTSAFQFHLTSRSNIAWRYARTSSKEAPVP